MPSTFLFNHFRLVLAAQLWLVAASLFFYSYWNPIYLLLILVSMVANFTLGLWIQDKNESTQDSLGSKVSKPLLIIGIVFNLGLFGYFKYADFFLSNLAWLTRSDIQTLNIVLPLAISFFTFQQIAYLVDCYQSKVTESNILNYALFVTFFPQLISGPIVHHKEMMPQFASLRLKKINYQNMAGGICIFTLGLFKKVVIADSLSVWVNAAFDSEKILHIYDAWLVTIAYSLQIYYDFSGYCDMAIGAALMLNIRLPVNFDSPLQAADIADFWRRWHMTLSRWLRDYLYIPLGGSRKGKLRTYINLSITMILGGLWHGAAWTFVIWGGMHGIALMIHRLWSRAGYRMHRWLGVCVTFLFFCISLILFRSLTLSRALEIFSSVFGFNSSMETGVADFDTLYILPFGFLDTPLSGYLVLSYLSVFYTLVALIIAWALPNALKIVGYIPYSGPLRMQAKMVYAISMGIIMFISVATFFGINRPSEFLYYNF